MTVVARVRYHVMTEGQHQMLQRKYGLTADDPYNFVVYERRLPLAPALTALLASERQQQAMAGSCRTEG